MPRESYLYKNLLGKILLSSFSILLLLLLLEIFSRLTENITFYDNTVNLQQGDVHLHRISSIPGLSYELIPLSKDIEADIFINSKGIRDREYEIPKPPDVFRIIILGDSITFGMGCKTLETYSKILEKKLNENLYTAKKYEVLNAGVYAYNAMQKVIFLESRLLEYDPDLVIFEFYNDDYQRTALLKLDNMPDVPKGEDSIPIGKKEIFSLNMARLLPLPYNLNKNLLEHSAFYRFLNMRFYNFLSKIDPIKYYPNAYKFIGGKFAVEYNRNAFNILNQLSQAKKFKVLIVAFPRLVNEDDNDIYVKTELEKLYGMNTLNLYQELKKRIDLLLLRRWPHDDCHLNPLGHKLAAQIIYKTLLEKHLLSK
jgi:hypothetical protein